MYADLRWGPCRIGIYRGSRATVSAENRASGGGYARPQRPSARALNASSVRGS